MSLKERLKDSDAAIVFAKPKVVFDLRSLDWSELDKLPDRPWPEYGKHYVLEDVVKDFLDKHLPQLDELIVPTDLWYATSKTRSLKPVEEEILCNISSFYIEVMHGKFATCITPALINELKLFAILAREPGTITVRSPRHYGYKGKMDSVKIRILTKRSINGHRAYYMYINKRFLKDA